MSADAARMQQAQESSVDLVPLLDRMLKEMRKEPLSRALSSEALGLLAARAAGGAVAWFGPMLREAVEAPAAPYPGPPVPQPRPATPDSSATVCPSCGGTVSRHRVGVFQLHNAGCSYADDLGNGDRS